MATKYATKITDSDGNVYDIKDTISGYTNNQGTVTTVSAGTGLTGGPITTTGTIKCALKSETKSSLTAASKGTTSSREYPVGLDKTGLLSVNVPWTDTTLTAGDNISISSGAISVANIGTVYTSIDVAMTVIPTATTCEFCRTSSLPAGTYIFMASITWSGASRNGYRSIWFSASSEGSNVDRFANSCIPAYSNNTGEPIVQKINCFIWKKSSAGIVYLNGYQNSGSTINISDHSIHAIRIK